MRAVRWAAGLCSVALLAACAVTAPEVSVGSGGASSGGGSAGGGTGTGGAADCTATSDCSGHGCACAPTAPAKFLGPVLFAVSGATIKCPATFQTDVLTGFTQVTAGDATCNDCACGSEPCGAVDVKAYNDSSCSNPLAMLPVQPEACQNSFTFQIKSVLVADAQTSSSLKCSHSGGGVKSLPPVSHNVATICSGDLGTSCKSGAVCVPAAEGPFEVCVYAVGLEACPSAFPHQHTMYTGMDDKRTCSDCGCAAPSATCPTTFDAFSSNDCTTGSFGIGDAGSCFSAPPKTPGKSIKPHVATPCAPSGGAPKGGIEKSAPYTVCCS